jgi:hypothetical protein
MHEYGKEMHTAHGKAAAGQLMYTRQHLPLDRFLMVDSQGRSVIAINDER